MNEFIVVFLLLRSTGSDHLIILATMPVIISREDSARNHAGTIAGESSSSFSPSPSCIIKILSDKQKGHNRFSLRRCCHHCYNHLGHMVGMSIQEKKEREGGNGLCHLRSDEWWEKGHGSPLMNKHDGKFNVKHNMNIGICLVLITNIWRRSWQLV